LNLFCISYLVREEEKSSEKTSQQIYEAISYITNCFIRYIQN